jgi:AhpD family alkylhydroperoxidase
VSDIKPNFFIMNETLNDHNTHQRLNVMQQRPDALKPLFVLGNYLGRSTIEESLRHLIYFRVSQINGCAYCLDMHYKDARSQGETEQRLYSISAWRETPYYTDRERAALDWAEAVTKSLVPDEVYAHAQSQFSADELIDLTMAVTAINSWNRINTAFLVTPGGYQVGQFKS